MKAYRHPEETRSEECIQSLLRLGKEHRCPICLKALPRGEEYRKDRSAVTYPVGLPLTHTACLK